MNGTFSRTALLGSQIWIGTISGTPIYLPLLHQVDEGGCNLTIKVATSDDDFSPDNVTFHISVRDGASSCICIASGCVGSSTHTAPKACHCQESCPCDGQNGFLYTMRKTDLYVPPIKDSVPTPNDNFDKAVKYISRLGKHSSRNTRAPRPTSVSSTLAKRK